MFHGVAQVRTRSAKIFDGLASLAMIAASGVIIWVSLAAPKVVTPSISTGTPVSASVPTTPLVVSDAHTKGDPHAPVVIVEYSEFQCPYCRSFARDVLPGLLREHVESGRVAFAFRHLPLERLHALAFAAAVVAECSGQQSRFWDAHDALFGLAGSSLSDAQLALMPTKLGLDVPRFSACLRAPETTAKIRSDAEAARALGVTGTPAFFVGLRQADGTVKVLKRLNGVQPLSAFAAVIKEVFEKLAKG